MIEFACMNKEFHRSSHKSKVVSWMIQSCSANQVASTTTRPATTLIFRLRSSSLARGLRCSSSLARGLLYTMSNEKNDKVATTNTVDCHVIQYKMKRFILQFGENCFDDCMPEEIDGAIENFKGDFEHNRSGIKIIGYGLYDIRMKSMMQHRIRWKGS